MTALMEVFQCWFTDKRLCITPHHVGSDMRIIPQEATTTSAEEALYTVVAVLFL